MTPYTVETARALAFKLLDECAKVSPDKTECGAALAITLRLYAKSQGWDVTNFDGDDFNTVLAAFVMGMRPEIVEMIDTRPGHGPIKS